ncbi:MAG: RNA polymerase sigma factor [Planctomycetaceae bacterium]
MASGDVEIMRRVQAGQVHLFDELVRRYRPALIRVARSKLGEADWAEDAVQETLLAAFAARDTYRPEFAFRTWLWTILLNICRRQWQRRAVRRAVPLSSVGFHPRSAGESVTFETGLAVLLQSERRDRVHRLLTRLPEAEADALRLRFLAELPYAEIAQAMNSSQSAAKQRVRRGLTTLTTHLRDDAGDP